MNSKIENDEETQNLLKEFQTEMKKLEEKIRQLQIEIKEKDG